MDDDEIRRVLGLLYQDDTLRAFAALVLETGSGLASEQSQSGHRHEHGR